MHRLLPWLLLCRTNSKIHRGWAAEVAKSDKEQDLHHFQQSKTGCTTQNPAEVSSFILCFTPCFGAFFPWRTWELPWQLCWVTWRLASYLLMQQDRVHCSTCLQTAAYTLQAPPPMQHPVSLVLLVLRGHRPAICFSDACLLVACHCSCLAGVSLAI